jgi:hypothetical protein
LLFVSKDRTDSSWKIIRTEEYVFLFSLFVSITGKASISQPNMRKTVREGREAAFIAVLADRKEGWSQFQQQQKSLAFFFTSFFYAFALYSTFTPFRDNK